MLRSEYKIFSMGICELIPSASICVLLTGQPWRYVVLLAYRGNFVHLLINIRRNIRDQLDPRVPLDMHIFSRVHLCQNGRLFMHVVVKLIREKIERLFSLFSLVALIYDRPRDDF